MSSFSYSNISALLKMPNDKYHLENFISKIRAELIKMKQHQFNAIFNAIFNDILETMLYNPNINEPTKLITIEDIVFQLSEMVIAISSPILTEIFENEADIALHHITVDELFPDNCDPFHDQANVDASCINDERNNHKALLKNVIRRALIIDAISQSVISEIGNIMSEYVPAELPAEFSAGSSADEWADEFSAGSSADKWAYECEVGGSAGSSADKWAYER